MPKYRERSPVIEAEQFPVDPRPRSVPWPAGVESWPDPQGFQPRDMSWGYIDTEAGREHVMAGDYIVTHANGVRRVVRQKDFEARYEPV